MVTDRDNESNAYARLSLRHAYGVSSGALPSCFGGQDDDLVVHAGTKAPKTMFFNFYYQCNKMSVDRFQGLRSRYRDGRAV